MPKKADVDALLSAIDAGFNQAKTGFVAARTAATALAALVPVESDTQPPPSIDSFTISKSTITADDPVDIEWVTRNASLVLLNGVEVEPVGKLTLKPQASTSWILIVSRAGAKDDQKVVDVTVLPKVEPQTINRFQGMPASVKQGGEIEFQWVTTNADAVLFDGEAAPLFGAAKRTPDASRSYTLVAKRGGMPDIEQSVAVTVQPVVVPEPDPQPMPGRLSAQGAYQHGGNPTFTVGPVDRIDVSKAGVEIPFDLRNYTDPVNKILAPSVNGVKVTDWLRVPLHGIPHELYWRTPILQNGAIRQYTPSESTHDFYPEALPMFAANYPNNGPRGRCRVDPYAAMHAHLTLRADGTAIPRAPYMLMLRVDGAVVALYLDGSVEILGWIPGTKGPLDFSFFPPAREFLFTADTYNNRIICTDRTPAIQARTGDERENGALWAHSELLRGTTNVTTVRATPDGTVYFAAGGIWRQRMTRDGVPVGSPELLSDFPAFWLDYLPDGDLVAAAITSECRIVSAVNGATKRIGNHPLMPSTSFISVSVDRNGTCAPVGTISLVPQHYTGGGFGTNNVLMTLHPGEDYARSDALYIPFGLGYSEIGPAQFISELAGHYFWGAEPGVDQAIFTMIGTGHSVPATFRPRRASDPVYDDYNRELLHDFWAVLMQGTVAGNEGNRPSFSAQMSPVGDGLLGVSADTIANMSIPDASTFIQNGMLGIVPRPELTGYPLYALHRGLVRHSQRWILEGAALMAAVDSFYGSPTRANVPELP